MHNLALPITGLYTGILGLIMLVLATRVSRQRILLKSSISLDASPELFEAVRRHGNFVEWVPFVLLLMAIAESNGLAPLHLHIAGGLLVFARILHPLGIRHNPSPHPLRAIGATLTFLIALVLCVVVIAQWGRIPG